MSKIKKTVAFSLLILTLFTAIFSATSCQNFMPKSDIIIVSRETFDTQIKLNEQGDIAKAFSPKRLAAFEVEFLQEGMEYCALIYIRKECVYKGEIEFGSESTPHLTLGKCYSISGSESGITLSLNSVGDGFDIKNQDKEISKSTYCAAFSFTFNGFESKEKLTEDFLDIKLSFVPSRSEISNPVEINKSVLMRKA